MLLKWLFLTILVWYAFRATGNLIRSMAGEQPRQSVPQGNDVHVPAPQPSQKASVPTSSLDVEDAQFEDL